jgi:cell wall-associated NlpC family hydrolase
MIIAVSSHNLDAAGRIYGHVGIYVGNGTVMDNIGYIRSTSVDSWISTFSGVVPARWGWLGGVVLA